MMKWIIVGLGNPGGEFASTRHNAGRIVVEEFRRLHGFSEWTYKKLPNAQLSKGVLAGKETLLVLPETFMNESGRSLVSLAKSTEQLDQLIVIHDDADLSLGSWRFAYARGAGGQKGVESIINTLKSRSFVRIRIGIAKEILTGQHREKAGDYVLEKFTEPELIGIKKIGQGTELTGALTTLFVEGLNSSRSKWKKWKESEPLQSEIEHGPVP